MSTNDVSHTDDVEPQMRLILSYIFGDFEMMFMTKTEKILTTCNEYYVRKDVTVLHRDDLPPYVAYLRFEHLHKRIWFHVDRNSLNEFLNLFEDIKRSIKKELKTGTLDKKWKKIVSYLSQYSIPVMDDEYCEDMMSQSDFEDCYASYEDLLTYLIEKGS